MFLQALVGMVARVGVFAVVASRRLSEIPERCPVEGRVGTRKETVNKVLREPASALGSSCDIMDFPHDF